MQTAIDTTSYPRTATGFYKIVVASSLGTVIEWYDFFLFASLTVFLASEFFPRDNPTAALLLSVGALGTGYVLRPVGGLVFGAMGDRIGRKRTFMLTMLLMGAATMLIGVLPTYAQIGLAAPALLVCLRLVQGLALGGEYGGAATYIAESVEPRRLGYATSWIQTTAGLGLALATGINLALQATLAPEDFRAWGWRIPFLLSGVLVALSTWFRLNLEETPVFAEMKRAGTLSASPVRAALTDRANLRAVMTTLFGVSIGASAVSGVVFLFTGIMLQGVLKVDPVFVTAGTAMGLLLATPAYPFFGALSDRLGRRKVILAGLVLNGLLMVPIFMGIARAAAAHSLPALAGLVLLETVLFASVYGPYAAFMAEAFPPHVRYTSISLPFNIAFSLIGGLLPLVSLSLIAATGNVYMGLAYPVALIAITVIVNLLYVRERVA